jgi:hypothetical protein
VHIQPDQALYDQAAHKLDTCPLVPVRQLQAALHLYNSRQGEPSALAQCLRLHMCAMLVDLLGCLSSQNCERLCFWGVHSD